MFQPLRKIEGSPSGHGLSGGPIAAELLLALNGRALYFDHKWLTCQHAVSRLDRGGVALAPHPNTVKARNTSCKSVSHPIHGMTTP